MEILKLKDLKRTEGVSLIGEDTLQIPKSGGGLDLTWLKDREERYLYFFAESETVNSAAFEMEVFSSREEGVIFDIRTGILGGVRTAICMDLQLMNGKSLFPETVPGQLKITCHGRRVDKEEITSILLKTLPYDTDLVLHITEMVLSDEYPENVIFSDGRHLPDMVLVDELGQNKRKEWEGKLHSREELDLLLQKQRLEADQGYPLEDWDEYGGSRRHPLTEGSGFFRSVKKEDRFYLADPLGNAFFSNGVDCVVARSDCRIDGMEKWLEFLPDEADPVYGPMFKKQIWPRNGEGRRDCTLFSYEQANLYHAFGENWYENWKTMIVGQLKKYGMNTLGNWSDPNLFGSAEIPYVTSLPRFPETKVKIFRDFPDVFSEEYQEDAELCAKALEDRKNDPWMIGYFLRNEPAWAFVDNLILADEVLYCEEMTCCKERLIEWIREKYHTIEALNEAWKGKLTSFDELKGSHKNVSFWSDQAKEDLRAFSRLMLDAYVGIPSKACRKVDQNHMILGMRWAWISDPDVITGWQYFDVFSINCYAHDPSSAIQKAVDLGVELPVMIGEFHFGALDAGPSSTGLEGVTDQKERGIAYRYYCERTAAHKNGVGCHYFQCYDQFTLGRFDGENYNIGLFDICSQPYQQMMHSIRESAEDLYEIAEGKKAPTENKAKAAAMIAF